MARNTYVAGKFDDDDYYSLDGRSLNGLWQIYQTLINDDGTPEMAVKGDRRRDLAQRMGALLDNADNSWL